MLIVCWDSLSVALVLIDLSLPVSLRWLNVPETARAADTVIAWTGLAFARMPGGQV